MTNKCFEKLSHKVLFAFFSFNNLKRGDKSKTASGARKPTRVVRKFFSHENRPLSHVMGCLWLHRWLEMQDLSFMRRLKPTTKVKVQVLYLIFNFEISSPF